MNTTLQILKDARQLISDPDRWFQGWYRDGIKICAITAINIDKNSSDTATGG